MTQEQRTSERHRVRFKLVYDDGESFNAGFVHDISESGLFLETALPLPIGTVVRLMPLEAAGEIVPELHARVMRIVEYEAATLEPPGMGLMFIELSDAERLKVVVMIRDQLERAAHPSGERDPFLGVLVPSTPST